MGRKPKDVNSPLRRHRIAGGWTSLEAFARAINYSKDHVSKVELGKTPVAPDLIRAYERTLRLPDGTIAEEYAEWACGERGPSPAATRGTPSPVPPIEPRAPARQALRGVSVDPAPEPAPAGNGPVRRAEDRSLTSGWRIPPRRALALGAALAAVLAGGVLWRYAAPAAGRTDPAAVATPLPSGVGESTGTVSATARPLPPGPNLGTFSNPPNGATLPEGTRVVFAWNPVPGATAYRLEFWGGPYDRVLASPWVSDTSFPVGQMHPGHTYHWRIKARTAAGESDWSPEWSFTISTAGAPNPTGCLAPPIAEGPGEGETVAAGLPVTLRWAPPTGCLPAGYTFRLNTAPDPEAPAPLEDTGIGSAAYSYAFGEAGTYYWHVRACLPCTPYVPGNWVSRRLEVR